MRGAGVRILVVGGGIAGLAAARTLRGWGATVEILERQAAPPGEGTGIYLPGNAVRALDTLGLGAQVAERAVHIRRQRTADHRGRVLFDVDVDELWDGVGACLALPRTDLHRVLLGGLDDVPIRWGQTPALVATDGAGVTLQTEEGHTDRYDLVLGADGVHSTVRRLVFDTDAVRPLGQYARRFLAPAGEPPHHDDRSATWSVLLGSGSAFLTIPIGNGHLYCYCDGPLDDPPAPLRDLLSDYADPVPTLLDALDTIGGASAVHAAQVEEVVLDSWSRTGVLLIGDAAHATSPNMAQGAAMAFEDAIVLAESLTTADSVTEALAAYERRRRPRTDWVLAQTHRRDRARTLPPALRNIVLRRIGRRIVRSNYLPLRAQP
ncbi:MAG: FAD-dependent monooxygenase [Pseudonocardia sp.]|nr:FAD-dependent monooxygenase [Pseudonocardia sp.]